MRIYGSGNPQWHALHGNRDYLGRNCEYERTRLILRWGIRRQAEKGISHSISASVGSWPSRSRPPWKRIASLELTCFRTPQQVASAPLDGQGLELFNPLIGTYESPWQSSSRHVRRLPVTHHLRLRPRSLGGGKALRAADPQAVSEPNGGDGGAKAQRARHCGDDGASTGEHGTAIPQAGPKPAGSDGRADLARRVLPPFEPAGSPAVPCFSPFLPCLA